MSYNPGNNQLTCAVVTPYKGLYSETFIRDQIAHLPCKVLPVYGLRSAAEYQDRRICSKLAAVLTSGKIPRLPGRFAALGEHWVDQAMADFLRRNRVDVVLAQFAVAGPPLMEVTQKAKIPLVVHCHGYDVYEDATLSGVGSQYRRMFGLAAALVVGSTDMRQQLIALGAPENKIHYIPVGVNTSRFFPGNPGTSPPVIVAVGRFVEKKAPYATILAFAQALKNCPEAKLVMVGNGPLLNVCKQMAVGLKIDSNVIFEDVLPPDRIRHLLSNARAFAQHSVRALNGDSEGTALSVLEAAASAVPVIATAHAGIKDTMIDGQTGFIVPELDIEAMGRAMITVLQDPELAQTLGQNGRDRVVAKFSQDRSIDSLHSLLRECASPQPSARTEH